MKNFSMLLLTIFFFSCQQKENKNPNFSSSDSIVATSPSSDSILTKNSNKEDNKQIGDTILMNFKNEKGLFIAEAALDSTHSKVYVKFKNEDISKLKGNIVPTTGKGNIRFNQIIFPDKSSDGPFGMDLEMPLTQKGDYILVIGHSLMADNPYYGEFKIQLENKKE